MVITYPKESFVPEKVTHTIDVDDKLLVVEHVPARGCASKQVNNSSRQGPLNESSS